MNKLKNFIHSDFGKYFMSVILGLGISCLFRKVCKDRDCIVFYAAPFDKIKDQIFKYNDKCYTFEENVSSCDKNKKTLEFEKKIEN
tara:strand:- start:469 stop:726 length:258 start_codon:yes stop_codon:yes gene_type:complete